MTTILVIAEHNNQTLKLATLNAVSAAGELADELDVLVMGSNCQKVAEQAAQIQK